MSALIETSNSTCPATDDQQIIVRFRTQQFTVSMPSGACLKDLKHKIQELTDVAPADQKLLGITVKDDDDVLPKITKKLMLMATAKPPPAAAVTATTSQQDDHAGAQEEEEDSAAGLLEDITNDPEDVQRALQRRITSTEVTILTPPRPGAHCLVRCSCWHNTCSSLSDPGLLNMWGQMV